MPVQLVGNTAPRSPASCYCRRCRCPARSSWRPRCRRRKAMTCDPDLSSSHIPSPHLLSSFEMTVQKSLFRHLLYWWPPHPPLVDKLLKNYYIFHKTVVIKSESNNFKISSPRIGKRCTCNILILIFSLDFDKQCQMCKKSSSRCLRVEFLGDVKKSDFFRVQDGEEMTIKFCP